MLVRRESSARLDEKFSHRRGQIPISSDLKRQKQSALFSPIDKARRSSLATFSL